MKVAQYVKELISGSHINKSADVTCFVLGSSVEEAEAGDTKQWDDRVIIRPMSYSVFIKRAEKRMLGLRDELRDVPFLQEQGLGAQAFLEPQLAQTELALG
jgi:hypothetical protein